MTAPLHDALAAALAASDIPHHLRGGLLRFLCDGILPGGFLQAVLANDLQAAAVRGAPESWGAVPAVVLFLHTHVVTPECWGSWAAVRAWSTTPDRLEP